MRVLQQWWQGYLYKRFCLGSLAVAGVLVLLFFLFHHVPETSSLPQLRIITYNVHGRTPDPKQLLALLSEQHPDLILLQEVRSLRYRWWSERLQLPYRHYARYQREIGGLAILSRWPLGPAQVLPFRNSQQGKIALAAPVYSPMGTLWACSVHLESLHYQGNGTHVWQYGPFLWKELFSTTPRYQQAEELTDWLSKLSAGDWVVAGDFNSFPFSRVDRYFSRYFDDALRQRPWRYFTGTYWDLPLSPIRPRIDYIYHSPRLQVLDAKVIEQKLSDHFPVLAIIAPSSTSAASPDSHNESTYTSTPVVFPLPATSTHGFTVQLP